jgi:hypothetical protein
MIGVRRLRACWLAFVSVAASLAASPAAPDSDLPTEMAVKATYLYKFVPFVTWPASAFPAANANFSICVVGNDALADSLAHVLAGQRNGDRPIAVRKPVVPDVGCQVLYVPGSDERQVLAALDAVRGKPVLTVTELPAKSTVHGVIAFVTLEDRVRFSIDAAEATHDGLTVSSRLLSLAVSVDK